MLKRGARVAEPQERLGAVRVRGHRQRRRVRTQARAVH